MRKSYVKILTFGAAVALGVMISNADAKVTGPCDDCHTMHNSQNGTTMGPDATPDRALTKGDCVGCHTDATAVIRGTTPIVLTTGGLGANTVLAGGNFYWVKPGGTSDAKGHNVVGINVQDTVIGSLTPPGWRYDDAFKPTGGSKAGNTGNWTSQLTCAGTYGCHGKHSDIDDFRDISGAHHGGGALDGSTVAQSYRFLMGITGIEDSDWENTYTDVALGGDHNVYKGKKRTADTTDTAKNTISFLCAECHGNFHSNSTVGTPAVDGMDDATFLSPWIRHPTDIDLTQGVTSEYAAYAYNHLWPVGVENLGVDVPGAMTGTAAIVTCISCHRAHGTDQPDLLRWDYSTMDAHTKDPGDTNVGCFGCHTTKDNI